MQHDAPDSLTIDDTVVTRPTSDAPLRAFCGVGIELEYAIVERDSLSVSPIADRLLAAGAGLPLGRAAAVERGRFGWSNELVQHVVEIKNREPAPDLAGLASGFAQQIAAIETILRPLDARLLPGAMHPWMNPAVETCLWPHAHADLYKHYHRIFDCARHGWANLQSMHVNLPFGDDDEFARLHAAIRLVLPIIPALAASSPVADGFDTECADYRLRTYRSNAAQLPSITGALIPETIGDRASYEARILAPMYREIAPHDPQGLLQHEWLNSRGAIARFDRNAIEIRVTDTQECPRADIAVAGAIIAVVRALFEERDASLATQQAISTGDLLDIMERCVTLGERAQLAGPEDAAYMALFGHDGRPCSAQQLWRHLVRTLPPEPGMDGWAMAALDHILDRGTLARRIRNVLGPQFSRGSLRDTYRELADCLRAGRMFCDRRVP